MILCGPEGLQDIAGGKRVFERRPRTGPLISLPRRGKRGAERKGVFRIRIKLTQEDPRARILPNGAQL